MRAEESLIVSEAVEVEETSTRCVCRGGRRGASALFQPIVSRVRLGQAGQRVVLGEEGDARSEALRSVMSETPPRNGGMRSALFMHGADRQGGGIHRAVLAVVLRPR